MYISIIYGLPTRCSGKESACLAGDTRDRCMFHPWAGRIPWTRKWQPAPVFLKILESRKFCGQRSLQATVHGVSMRRTYIYIYIYIYTHTFIDYAKAFDYVNHNKLWKILQEMGIPDHLTCLLRNLYAGQEATVRTGHGTTDWFQIGKGVCQGCLLSPYLFNLYVEYIMRNTCWKKHKLELRLPGEIPITSDMQMTPPLWHKVKRN